VAREHHAKLVTVHGFTYWQGKSTAEYTKKTNKKKAVAAAYQEGK
jgi:hypothetical protein